MMGILERGEVKLVNEVKPYDGVDGTGFRGRLSIPGAGTRFTQVYPNKDDAIIALVDLNAEVYGNPNLAPPIDKA